MWAAFRMSHPGFVHYFVVLETETCEVRYLGANGQLTESANTAALHTFDSLADAYRFFESMGGRYAGGRLKLRWHARNLPSDEA